MYICRNKIDKTKKRKVMKNLVEQLEKNMKSVYGCNFKHEVNNYKKLKNEVKKAYKSGNIHLAEEIVLNITRY